MPAEVMTIVLIIWVGIALFLFRLDRKLKKIEEDINEL
jgi:CcmD family protein